MVDEEIYQNGKKGGGEGKRVEKEKVSERD